MKNYVEKNLMNSEVIIQHTYGHWIAFARSVGITISLIALWAFLPNTLNADPDHWLAKLSYEPFSRAGLKGLGWILIIGVFLFFLDYLRWLASEFAVTNRRVMVKYGLIKRRTGELFMERIESVSVNQTILGRILGFGNVNVTGIGDTSELLKNVPNPLTFRKTVQSETSKRKRTKRTSETPSKGNGEKI